MKLFVVILTSATLLCHATFGCCAHQADRRANPTHECSETNDHQHADHSVPSRDLPADDHPCCHVKCKWLKPDSYNNANPFDEVGCHATLGWMAADFDHSGNPLGASTELQLADTTLAHPLRTHLLVGVLLI